MFVGHAALAFAVVALLATRGWGWRRRDALVVGLVAAAFATIPDIDMLYAPVGLLGARLDALALASAFWSTSTVVHRGVTHSLVVAGVVGVVAVVAFLGYHRRKHWTRLGVAAAVLIGAGLVAGVALDAGALGGLVTAAFVASAVAVSWLAARRTTLGPRAFAAAAAFGLLSHPFGDLFTGEPPAFLYPFDVVLFAERVSLAGDPTLHLLAAFAVELLTIWFAVAVYLDYSDLRLRETVLPRVAVAAGYAASVFLIPPPTLDLSYPFVLSVVAVGAVGAVPRVRLVGDRRVTIPDRRTALVTALSAVTVAWAAYAVAYLLL
ncbi:metal-dependent hydrolase [Salinigranum sp. GCM10025319]|uniref:metal-dependent hydrolase n=1 Tax=Salinigranum sp. GCM10025319 TaxID=3252687 RepID=UPI00361D76B6